MVTIPMIRQGSAKAADNDAKAGNAAGVGLCLVFYLKSYFGWDIGIIRKLRVYYLRKPAVAVLNRNFVEPAGR
jgi:hypothetical protein